jgi:hypothetical protein
MTKIRNKNRFPDPLSAAGGSCIYRVGQAFCDRYASSLKDCRGATLGGESVCSARSGCLPIAQVEAPSDGLDTCALPSDVATEPTCEGRPECSYAQQCVSLIDECNAYSYQDEDTCTQKDCAYDASTGW